MAVASGGQAARRHGVVYNGRAGELAPIVLTNGLLTLITVGFYRFWGKTRLRRYLWSHVSFLGDRLEYSGRGLELFLGFLVILVILAPPSPSIGPAAIGSAAPNGAASVPVRAVRP
jgi:uncharacterized membrane protein YjgN (DUF898 family)